jgi:flagellar biosynthetic protein FliQ
MLRGQASLVLRTRQKRPGVTALLTLTGQPEKRRMKPESRTPLKLRQVDVFSSDFVVSGEVFMNGGEVLDVGRDAIWLTIQLCAPVLLIGLVVGVTVGLFQALTQIQEQTLTFVPKALAIFMALMLFLPFMGSLLAGFMRQIAARIAGL